MLAAIACPAGSSEPLHHLTITTDPLQSYTRWRKLVKTWQNKAHSSCCHLQSPANLLSRCPSCVWTDLRVASTCSAQTGTGAHTPTHTDTHKSLPPRMDERQQAGQIRHRFGSVEGYTWSCQQLNLGSAPLQFFPPQQFKMGKRYAISCGQFVTVNSQCLDTI